MTKNTLTVTAAALAALVAQHARSDDLTHKPKVGETLIVPAIYSKMLAGLGSISNTFISTGNLTIRPTARARRGLMSVSPKADARGCRSIPISSFKRSHRKPKPRACGRRQ
jgi:hypothetical protein